MLLRCSFFVETFLKMKAYFVVFTVSLCFLTTSEAAVSKNKTFVEHLHQQRSGKIFIRPFLNIIRSKLDMLNEKIGWKQNMTRSTAATPTTVTSTTTTTSSPSVTTSTSTTTETITTTPSAVAETT